MIRTTVCLMCFVIVSAALGIGRCRAGEPVSLFDGKTLDGWDVLRCQAIVKDKAILLEGGNGLVQTKKRYGDFVLEYEWKATQAGRLGLGSLLSLRRSTPGQSVA